MPGRIRKIYDSLIRTLDLEGNFGGFVLQEEAVPVVVLHEHCEGAPMGGYAEILGANAAATMNTMSFSRGGAYQITMYFSWIVAAAQTRSMLFRLEANNTAMQNLWRISYGFAGQTAGNLMLTIPKIHVEEGYNLVSIMQVASQAGDLHSSGYTVQPI